MNSRYWLTISAVVADTSTTAWGVASTQSHSGGFAASANWGEWQWITTDYYYVPYDLNCDDQFNGTDQSMYLQICQNPIIFIYPGWEPSPLADLDCNGIINLADCVYAIGWIYGGGPAPCYYYPYPPGDSISAAISVTEIVAPFVCGDPDRSEVVNIADAVYMVNFIFSGGGRPDPMASGDVQCDGMVNISDVVYLIRYIFGGGPQPCEGCL